MKYLKKYKTFKESLKEETNIQSEIAEDVEDLLIDLIDTGKINMRVKSDSIIIFNYVEIFESNSVIYYVEKVINYLKSRNISDIVISVCIADTRNRQKIMDERGFTTPVPTLNLETYKEEIKDLSLNDITIDFSITGGRFNSKKNESILIDLEYQRIDDLLESLNVWHDALLTSIDAEEVDIFDTFNLPREMFSDKLDLDFLDNNVEFVNSLSSIALKKSELKNSEDFETFLNKPCKFMFIYDINSNELENPEYLLFQVWNESLSKWEDVKLYKIKEDVSRFYNKLTSRTIEITDGDENYIYSTSNGNEWILQNSDKENDIYKKTFRKEEIQDLLKDRNVKINVI